MRLRLFVPLIILCLICCVSSALGQTETATLSGIVTDPQGKPLSGVDIQITNQDTNVTVQRTTNAAGLYVAVGLKPGRYRVSVAKEGFRTVNFTDLVLNVQDVLSRNFQLQLGPVSTSITVVADENKINTADATVSTVVDRRFAENLPLNGRSFQTLIELAPGVVVVTSNHIDKGQFTVNGQRAVSNYWMVDGVSANIGVAPGSTPGNGFGGALGAFSAQGGTNSLVSVDAMQEFRIQTSTYAPEFGRTPGGQISIVTRSGTNQFQGTAFDYFRNDSLDTSDWFVKFNKLQKPEERQNDFGLTFGGPVVRDKTFFFFSYEGLRLRLPRVLQSTVPDLNVRQSALPALQPYLNAYPLPNGVDNAATGAAQFNASFADRSILDAYSLRIDHDLFNRVILFGRYNNSPSESLERGSGALSMVSKNHIGTQTATLGTTWAVSPTLVNDLRLNYSHVTASNLNFLDNFGGAVPYASLPVPSGYTDQNSNLNFFILSLNHGVLQRGTNGANLQRQINFVDSASFTRGTHVFKLGVDYRQLSPTAGPPLYFQTALFNDPIKAKDGMLLFGNVQAQLPMQARFRNFGAYVQDAWNVIPRMTLTYGLRWDLDFAPKSVDGPALPALTGYDLNDLSRLAIAPAGTRLFKTDYGNVAPRVGLAYQLNENPDRAAVVRGGAGVFYDLIGSALGLSVLTQNPPFGAVKTFAGSFPVDATVAAPPPIATAGSLSRVLSFNPNLKSPYTLEWNIAMEQALGAQQTISASYVGAAGRRLLQTFAIFGPTALNPNIGTVQFVDNTASSSYNALQLQFQRRLSRGLQVLSSYTWAHSIDTASAGSNQVVSNAGLPGSDAKANRAPSDFDIRHTFSAGVTYDIPAPRLGALAEAILGGWSIDSSLLARSAPPVDVQDTHFNFFDGGILGDIRPDRVAGQPLYLYGANCASVMQALKYLAPGQGCPGGKALNPNAFQDPPIDPVTKRPARQGNVARNSLRGFGALQWDLALHRIFTIRDATKLQFRAEVFNVLNHPNFGQPSGTFGRTGFGLSSQTLAQYLNGGVGGANAGAGAFSPLYQIGGPRSIQLGLKLFF